MLEVGAGTGETIKYYDKTQIDVIYGVEPNVNALGRLKKALVDAKSELGTTEPGWPIRAWCRLPKRFLTLT